MKRERRDDRDDRGERHHRRRVYAREPFHEGLGRRTLRLRPLDEVDDARQRRIAAEPRHADVERATAVDGPGEDLVARLFLDRERFAGDGRLIDRALPGQNQPVQRNLFTRANHDRRAWRDALDVDAPLARVVAHQRLGGREVHQRANGASGAIQSPRLE